MECEIGQHYDGSSIIWLFNNAVSILAVI